jgi:hypothetical protein
VSTTIVTGTRYGTRHTEHPTYGDRHPTHGTTLPLPRFTGLTRSVDENDEDRVGSFAGEDLEGGYKMTTEYEREAHDRWNSLGRPAAGTVVSSVYEKEPPRTKSRATVSDDGGGHGDGFPQVDVDTGATTVELNEETTHEKPMSLGGVWATSIAEIVSEVGAHGKHGYPYLESSCNLDSFLVAELAAYAAAPHRLARVDMGRARRTNELARTLLSLAPMRGTLQ